MSDNAGQGMLHAMIAALGLSQEGAGRIAFSGNDRLPSCWPVSDLAAASVAAAATAISDLVGMQRPQAPKAAVSYRLASLWFGWSIQPMGWQMPDPWDPIAGDYKAQDAWIKLHTNAPHHRSAALAVLGCEPTRDAVAQAVAGYRAGDLEAAIVAAGGCAAEMRSGEAWAAHPQGNAVSGEPLIIWEAAQPGVASGWRPTAERPLNGLRVLDLTRIIAGPVATRFLAGYGAEVLRIDPPAWEEDAVAPEVMLGKRSARLDLKTEQGRDHLRGLLSAADVLVHGYRKGALDGIGLDRDTRQAIRPGLIDISLNAYGHSGPWERRRGFDSLVQFSSGIAAAGMAWRRSDTPVSLPVQALDHATGYLLAAATIRALIARTNGSRELRACLSLARTAKLLTDFRGAPHEPAMAPASAQDYQEALEQTGWGPARRLRPPVTVEGIAMSGERPAGPLGSSAPKWPEP